MNERQYIKDMIKEVIEEKEKYEFKVKRQTKILETYMNVKGFNILAMLTLLFLTSRFVALLLNKQLNIYYVIEFSLYLLTVIIFFMASIIEQFNLKYYSKINGLEGIENLEM